MPTNLEVNPADIKFTQDSISLYFKYPYEKFSVREAVIKLSQDEMRPDDFPPIRVNSYGGRLWSIDNRRLWIFRLARCSSINVKLVSRMHHRVKDVLFDGDLYSIMGVEDIFPRLRDRGIKDRNFDQRFPQPVSSLQLPVDEALEKPPNNVAQVSSVDTEISWTSLLPAKPSTNPVEEHKYGHIEINIDEECGTIGPTKPSIPPTEDLAKKNANVRRMIRNALGSVVLKIDSVAREIGRMIRNAVGSVVLEIYSVARKVGRMIINAGDSVFLKIFSIWR